MSLEQPHSEGSLPPELIQILRQLLGDQADSAIEAMRQDGFDPSKLFESNGQGTDPASMSALASQVADLMASSQPGQSVNWDLAKDAARRTAAAAGADPVVNDAEIDAVQNVMRIADLWLDEVTEFPATGGPVLALSAAQWIEHTWDQWQVITTPIAESTTKAMTGMMAQQAMEHPGLSQALDEVTPMFRSLIGALFGIQIGQAIGTVSRDVFGLSDIGLALGPPKAMAQLPSTIKKFATDLDLPDAEVRLFLAIREAAHARLFSSVPWLKDNLFASVEAYAAGISIDLERMETQMRQLDLSDAETVRHALSSGVFAPAVSPAQKAALTRLETALALVEGWVDVVASAAGQNRLPSLAALRELVRRRRAVGGPAEQTFAGLVGLELRPRQAREAAKLWAGVTDQLGQAGREAIWAHPDIMPTTEDLAEPDSYLERRAERQAKDAAVDAEIQAFFEAQED